MEAVGKTTGMQQRHNHKRGFNLIEAAIVLAVVGLVVAGIWVAASAVHARWEETHFYEQVSHIVRMAQKRFPQSVPCDTGYIGTAELQALGIYPLDAPDGTGVAYWGMPSIWIACDGTFGNYANGANYIRLVWWPYGDESVISTASCKRVSNFFTASFRDNFVEPPDCDTHYGYVNIAFGFALPRLN